MEGPGRRSRHQDDPGSRADPFDVAFGAVSAKGLAELADRRLDAGDCEGISPSAIGGHFVQLAELKRKSPELHFLISLGGWTGSKYFAAAVATPVSRVRFAQSVIETFFQVYPGLFDGADVDWEFPVSGGVKGVSRALSTGRILRS
ncbi:glycosyl hydrolase family 18 protein [Bradyrhizobium sp. USDA 4529]